MNSYLYNVSLSAMPYILVGLVLFGFALFWPRNTVDPIGQKAPASRNAPALIRKWLRQIALLIAVLGIILGMAAPSNTPKNTLNVDRQAENQKITEQIMKKEVTPVQDIAAKPALTDAQRKEQFDALVDRSRFEGSNN